MAVTPNDVAIVLGRTVPNPSSVEGKQWDLWISDALMLIEQRRALVAPNKTLDPAVVDYVVREAVAAHVRRPDDATTVNTAVDDASIQRTYRSSSGRVAIVEEWWRLLGLSRAGKAFTVPLVDLSGSGHLPWCNIMFGASWCSCGADIAGHPIFEGGTDDWE